MAGFSLILAENIHIIELKEKKVFTFSIVYCEFININGNDLIIYSTKYCTS